MGRAKQYCLFLSKREKNLTLKTYAAAFLARSMTKLYAKIKGARAISLFDFPKTWQVCYPVPVIGLVFNESTLHKINFFTRLPIQVMQ